MPFENCALSLLTVVIRCGKKATPITLKHNSIMNTNRVSATLSAEDRAAVFSALETIRQKLPFLLDLSPEERRSLPKTGDKSRAFVAAALTLAAQNPDVLPRKFDLPEFQKDVALMEALAPVAAAVQQLWERIDDTLTAVGSDAYTAALLVYHSARMAGRGEGLDQQLDGLAARFARKSRVVSPNPPQR